MARWRNGKPSRAVDTTRDSPGIPHRRGQSATAGQPARQVVSAWSQCPPSGPSWPNSATRPGRSPSPTIGWWTRSSPTAHRTRSRRRFTRTWPPGPTTSPCYRLVHIGVGGRQPPGGIYASAYEASARIAEAITLPPVAEPRQSCFPARTFGRMRAAQGLGSASRVGDCCKPLDRAPNRLEHKKIRPPHRRYRTIEIRAGNRTVPLSGVGFQAAHPASAGTPIDEDLVASGRGEGVALSVGVLVGGRAPSLADSHGAERIGNPRQVDIAAYAVTFTDPACGNILQRRVSRERSLARHARLAACQCISRSDSASAGRAAMIACQGVGVGHAGLQKKGLIRVVGHQ